MRMRKNSSQSSNAHLLSGEGILIAIQMMVLQPLKRKDERKKIIFRIQNVRIELLLGKA